MEFIKKYVLKKLIIILLFFTTSCHTPVNQLNYTDYVWSEFYISENYQQIYRNLKKGIDVCSYNLSFLVDNSDIYTDINEAVLVLYLKNILGDHNGFVLGRVDLKKVNEKTRLRIGIQTIYAKPLFGNPEYDKTLLKLAQANYACDDI